MIIQLTSMPTRSAYQAQSTHERRYTAAEHHAPNRAREVNENDLISKGFTKQPDGSWGKSKRVRIVVDQDNTTKYPHKVNTPEFGSGLI